MCHALCDHFATDDQAPFILFATHFSQLASLQMYPSVQFWRFLVEQDDESRLHNTHQIEPGQPSKWQNFTLPNSVV